MMLPKEVFRRSVMEEKATQPRPAQSTARTIVGKIHQVSDRFEIVSLRRHIDACEGLLARDQLIDVAILGQFKAGKSSFINSLIGQDVLPVGVIPVTTVITRLRHGDRPLAVVTRFDASTVEVPVDEVGEFISEEKNPANVKNVEVVDILLPGLARYPGLRLVDTPGLGSVFKYNTETSEEWLPHVGAAIVAVSADRPLSDNDLSLLRDLARYTPKILLLLTKADLLSRDQQKEVIRFFRSTLQREINQDLPVYPYSTKVRTDLLKSRIETLLLGLSKNRDAEFISIFCHKVASLAKSAVAYLEIALKTSEKADEDRESLKNLILTETLNYDLIRSELFAIARENMLQTRTFIATRLETKRAGFTGALIANLQKEMPGWKGSLWKLTRRYEEWLEENLTRDLSDLSREEHRHFFGTLNKTYMSVSRSLDLFRNILDRNIETVLGIKLSPAEWDISVPEPTRPDVAFAKVFDFHLDLLWFLIPMVIFRGVFERHFLKKVPGIAQMHLSRLAYQWEIRINRIIEEARDQALKYVQDELATIDALLSRTAGQSEEIRKTIDELRDGQQVLTGSRDA
jgi:GTP-binding protein EngB required for normal cell division